MNRWVPDNTHPDHSSHVTEVPITPNVCKLKNEKGRIVRKQENSHAEVYGVLATYCPCDGGDPTIIMDPYCGTGVLCLGGIRQNVTGIYMNDQDGNCVDLARGRALEYFVGCREVGFIIPDGNGGWKAVQPTRAEIDFQAMYAIGRILQNRKAKPGNNYPLEYKRNHDGLNTRCLAANVFVAESTIKAGAKGLFAKMPFLEGTDVVPFIGKLHYDEELTKVSKHPERLWNSADESLATALEGCIYSPATFVQNGSDGKTLGTGAATFPNLKVKINENLSLSDSGRYTYVTTRPVKATEELFADFTTPFFEFRKAAMDKKKRRQSASKRSRVSNDDDTDDDDEVPIAGVNSVEEPYIETVLKEWQLYVNHLGAKPRISELHLGGGTPTFFSSQNLKKLIDGIFKLADRTDNCELSYEGHPNHTSKEQLQTLFDLGFHRNSFGVQDYDPKVQKTIKR